MLRTLMLATALLLWVSTAAAQDRAAEALLSRGSEFFRQGQYAAALELFEEAHRRGPTGQSTAQIGVTEHALGHYLRAFVMIRKALTYSRDPWINARRRRTLQEALEATRDFVAEVHVRAEVPVAAPAVEVVVNGESAGNLPLTEAVPVLAGLVNIELRTAGAEGPFEARRITVEPRATATMDFGPVQPALRAQASQTTQNTTRALSPAAVSVEPARSAPEAPSVPATESNAGRGTSALTIAGWASLSLGAVGLVTGAVFHVLREDVVNEHNGRADCGTALTVEGEGCAELRRSGSTRQTAMIVGYAVGGAALVTGIVMLLLPREEHAPADSTTASVRCAPSLGNWGAACSGTF